MNHDTADGFSFLQLLNPLGSGVIANLSHVTVSGDTKVELEIRLGDDVVGDELATAIFRDQRKGGFPSCEMRRQIIVPAKSGSSLAIIQIDGALSQTASWNIDAADPRQPLSVLGPGDYVNIAVRDDTLAQIIRANFLWIEIPITEQNPAGGLP